MISFRRRTLRGLWYARSVREIERGKEIYRSPNDAIEVYYSRQSSILVQHEVCMCHDTTEIHAVLIMHAVLIKCPMLTQREPTCSAIDVADTIRASQ